MGRPTFSTISERLNEDDSQKRVKSKRLGDYLADGVVIAY
jgi:hypothetical protein